MTNTESSNPKNDADQNCKTPLAWKYMLGDGKWRYQKDWSNGAQMIPVFEMTDEIKNALSLSKI